MKRKSSLALAAALVAAGILCMNRLSAEAAGEQTGQEQSAETQDESIAAQEETAQPVAVQSGTCGENVTWTFDEKNGTLTISGSGEMSDMVWDGNMWIYNKPWEAFQNEIKSVKIEEGITGINSHAFADCGNLTDVTFPESLLRIGLAAFSRCRSLEDVGFPGHLTNIGMYAFSECGGLTDIVLPGNVAVDWNAFSECGNLERVIISDGIKEIGQEVFYKCTNLKEIEIPASVSKLEDRAFGDCFSLKIIYFKGGVPEFATMHLAEKGNDGPAFGVFDGVTATVYYPDDPSWNADTMKDYGGDLTWLRRLYIIAEEAGIEVTDKVYVIGSGTDATIKCSGAAEDFVSLAIDGKIVDPSDYKVESGSTVLTVLSAFLDKLSVGDHTATLNYTYGSVDTVLTVIKKTEETAPGTNPADPTKPADNSGQAGQTGSADQQTGVRKSPQTGEEQTGSTWPMTLAILGIGGTALLILKRKTAGDRS